MYKKSSLIIILFLTLITSGLYAGKVFLTGTLFPWQENKELEVSREIKIGILPIEESLPFLVAQEKGYFKKEGVEVRLIPFNSALELNSALQAKEIDGQVSDLVISGQLEDNGFDVGIVSLCLGSTAKEGRFAILAAPKSGINSLKDLSGVPIAISNNSISEYVTDRLLTKAKVPQTERKQVIIRSLPIRMQMLLSGQVKAATLPDPLVAGAIAKGAKLIADDTGDNISQSVLLFRQAFLDSSPKEVRRFLKAYALGVKELNSNSRQYKKTLSRQAGIPENISESYEINKFPLPQIPAREDVDKVLNWMKRRGMVSNQVTYDKLVVPHYFPKE